MFTIILVCPTDRLPKCYQQGANRSRLSGNTLASNITQTVGQQSADGWLTVNFGNCSSLLPVNSIHFWVLLLNNFNTHTKYVFCYLISNLVTQCMYFHFCTCIWPINLPHSFIYLSFWTHAISYSQCQWWDDVYTIAIPESECVYWFWPHHAFN